MENISFPQWFRGVATGRVVLLKDAPTRLSDIPTELALVVLDERLDLGVPEIVSSQEHLDSLRKYVEPRQCTVPYIHVSVSLGFPERIVWSLFPAPAESESPKS